MLTPWLRCPGRMDPVDASVWLCRYVHEHAGPGESLEDCVLDREGDGFSAADWEILIAVFYFLVSLFLIFNSSSSSCIYI